MKRRFIVFSCGHRDYIQYSSTSDLLKQMKRAETKGLCSRCKREAFLADAETLSVKYGEYKEYFAHKRNVVVGEYNKETGEIQITVPSKLAEKYRQEKAKVFYDMRLKEDTSERTIITVFIKGNSFRLKDDLKQLHFRWVDKHWCRDVVVFTSTDEYKTRSCPVNENPELFELLVELESLGCIKHITALHL